MKITCPSRFMSIALGTMLLTATAVVRADERAGGQPNYLAIVRAYADTMLEHGRDRWGAPSPLFASQLDRTTHDLIGFELEEVDTGSVRIMTSTSKTPALFAASQARDERMYDGSNPAHDDGLFNTLYLLSEVVGDAKYAQAADEALRYWALNCQDERTGMMAWGEHVGWHLPSDTWLAASGASHLRIHELWQPTWSHYDRVYALGSQEAAAMMRFARGMWRHQIRDHDKVTWSRHAHMDSDPVGRTGYEFPRLIGQHVNIWSHAYARSDDSELREELLTAIHRTLDRSIERAHPNGAFGFGTRPDMQDFFTLPSHVLLITSIHGSRERLPAGTVERIDRVIAMAAGAIKGLPHDLEAGGRGYVNYATASTLEAGDPRGKYPAYADPWFAHGGSGHASRSARELLAGGRLIGDDALHELGVKGARMYLGQEVPIMPVEGRWLLPDAVADAIELMLDMHERTGEAAWLEQADAFARAGIDIFLDDVSPLPKIASRDHKSIRHVYESATGGDDLMLALLRLYVVQAQASR